VLLIEPFKSEGYFTQVTSCLSSQLSQSDSSWNELEWNSGQSETV